jgi:hypothetical protein
MVHVILVIFVNLIFMLGVVLAIESLFAHF